MSLRHLISNADELLAAGAETGYAVDDELRDLFLEMEATRAAFAAVSHCLTALKSCEYSAALLAYRAYWDAVDARAEGGAS
jgi:hypothetical protein